MMLGYDYPADVQLSEGVLERVVGLLDGSVEGVEGERRYRVCCGADVFNRALRVVAGFVGDVRGLWRWSVDWVWKYRDNEWSVEVEVGGVVNRVHIPGV
jgi:hypothetical protein